MTYDTGRTKSNTATRHQQSFGTGVPAVACTSPVARCPLGLHPGPLRLGAERIPAGLSKKHETG